MVAPFVTARGRCPLVVWVVSIASLVVGAGRRRQVDLGPSSRRIRKGSVVQVSAPFGRTHLDISGSDNCGWLAAAARQTASHNLRPTPLFSM